jgi:hypothetical protein
MAVVVPVVSGVPDRRQGWNSGAGYTEAELAEYRRRQEAGRPRHPAEIAAERAAAELRREEERRAAHPDPRGALREAHAALAGAKAELDRIVELREKAGEHFLALEAEHERLSGEVRLGNASIVDRLISALDAGAEHLPGPGTHAAEVQLDAVTTKLGVARGAVSQLTEYHASALKAVLAAEAGVATAAVALAVDFAVIESEAIEAQAAELHARRSALFGLSSAITTELRRLGPGAPWLPVAVGRAIGAIDTKIDPVWYERLKRLREDPEAELG